MLMSIARSGAVAILAVATATAIAGQPPAERGAWRVAGDGTRPGFSLHPPRATRHQARDRYGDPLPAGALFRFGSVRSRHPGGINDSALSPDGKLLATTGKTSVIIWELASGLALHTFEDAGAPDGFGAGHKLTFSPDGKILAQICAGDVMARLRDVATGREIATAGKLPPLVRVMGVPVGMARRGPVAKGDDYDFPPQGVRFSADGKELLVHAGHTVYYFDPHTGAERAHVRLQIELSSFSADSEHCCGTLRSKVNAKPTALIVCLTRSGKEELRLPLSPTDPDGDFSCAFSQDGGLLGVGDSRLRLWKLAGGVTPSAKEVWSIAAPKDDLGLTRLCFSLDGNALFVGTGNGDIHRFETASGREVSKLIGHVQVLTDLHCTPDAKELVSTGWDETIRRWDLASGKQLPLADGYSAHPHAAFSPDGKLVAVADRGGRLDLWDAGTGALARSLQASGPGIRSLEFLDDKTLITGGFDPVVRFRDVASGAETRSLKPPPNPRARPGDIDLISSFAFTREGRRLLTASSGGLCLWDLVSGKLAWSVGGGTNSSIAMSPDGKQIVSGGFQRLLTYRNPATGNVEATVVVPQRVNVGSPGTTAIAFSPDGSMMATAHRDGVLRLWDAATHNVIGWLEGHADLVWALDFSRDGNWLISGSSDQTVRVWEVATGQEATRFSGKGWIRDVHFSRDQKTILATDAVSAIVWRAPPDETGKIDISTLWTDLGTTDSAKAYRTVWALADRPAQAAALLREKIPPVKVADAREVTRLLKQLRSSRFTERDAAAKSLASLGRQIEPALRKALERETSEEVRGRIKVLLGGLTRRQTPEAIRESRAVEALELSGSREAAEVLRLWASGAASAPLTEDAAAALRRAQDR
jgi:WD40 repeat protein